MKIQNLPRYNTQDIESKATTLLLYFSSTFFNHHSATPLISIVDFLKAKHNIVFKFDSILGFNNNNYRILGACNPQKRIILIDSSLQSDIHKFNFTLAHELGHLALHRNIKIKYEEIDELDTTETVIENNSKNNIKTDADWMEWQANTYASCLLMPTEIIKTLLIKTQANLGISRTGTILLDNQPCNNQDYYNILITLSEILCVSKSAIEYRLQKLKLIDDRRKSYKKIGEYLK